MRAAFHILKGGCLNIKDKPYINVKQAKAFLQMAWMLQRRASRRWVCKGDLAEPSAPQIQVLVFTPGFRASGRHTYLVPCFLDDFPGLIVKPT